MTKTRIIGIDYGTARIGLAFSDETKIIASPLSTIKTEKKLELTVDKLISEIDRHKKEYRYEVESFVVGLPLMMTGKSGVVADEVIHFVNILKAKTGCSVTTWDERLTSVQAERSLMEYSMTRKKRTQFIDQMSAVIILQNYLDSCRIKIDFDKDQDNDNF